MQRPTFSELFTLLSGATLSSSELAQLRAWIAGIRDPSECLALVEAAAAGRPCPHCSGMRLHRCGRASGLQRFRCLGCARSFNALTGTPLARLRKRERWLPYLQCMLESRTVRQAARDTGVHRTTSFRWRHRFGPGAGRHRPSTLSAIVEADETYRLESQKGARQLTRPPRRRGGAASRRGINREHDCLLVVRDRSGLTLDFHTGRGPVTAAQLRSRLTPVLSPDVLLISDSAAAYARFAAETGITHAPVNLRAGRRARGAIHLQNVNGWHSRFKSWLMRFKGVASRYLANYSGWQRLLDAHELETPAQWLCAAVRQAQSRQVQTST
ncbi:IS1595 family transposase [Massilia sp. 9096]|uniref:IS1595 family transposase n=1 Tax=Massilia sp. 9096 TaxID=1500894 RepID=UPI0009DF337A|nr:IS1595 family transposase [Massilia sp. 9096]